MNNQTDHINQLVTKFYACFDNRDNKLINAEQFQSCFIQDASICKRTDSSVENWTLKQFWKPRFELLTNGSLTEFYEWETGFNVSVSNGIGSRYSTYEKSGLFDGHPYAGTGTKYFQFALTCDGWKIVQILWEDH